MRPARWVKAFLWIGLAVAVAGLCSSSGYSLIPKQVLPFRWAVSLTPAGLIQGAFESDERKSRIVRYVLEAPAIRPGYGDVPSLWVWGVAVSLTAWTLLFLHFPRHQRKGSKGVSC